MIEGYDFKEKNQWRKWVWKEVKVRLNQLNISPKRAVVMYLAGNENLDRDLAKNFKIRNYNMFAVESDKEAIKSLRGKGVNVINGNLEDVTKQWTGPPYIDILLADFCNGMSIQKYKSLITLFMSGCMAKKSIAVFNLQRGRDFNDMSKEAKTAMLYLCEKENERNRAKFLIGRLSTMFESAKKMELYINNVLQPVYRTYRNTKKHTTMDSVIFTIIKVANNAPIYPDKKLKARIAAAKAIRTMRMAA